MSRLKYVQKKVKTAVVNKSNQQSSPPAKTSRIKNPHNLSDPHTVSHLQRTIGNQAVRRLFLQRKMSVGPVDDPYEREADAVAKQVVGSLSDQSISQRQEDDDDLQMKPVNSGQQPSISQLQRQEQEQEDEELQAKAGAGMAGGELNDDVENGVQRAKSGGNTMDNTIRRSMEGAFGANFGGVKIHTGGQANTLNRSLNARAFTSGRDVFFRDGEYNPGSSGGKELLAHELTHVVQQTGTAVNSTQSNTINTKTEAAAIQRAIHPKVERALTITAEHDPDILDAGYITHDGTLIEKLRDGNIIPLKMQKDIIHLWDRSKKKKRGNDEELTTRMDFVRAFLIKKFVEELIAYRMQRNGQDGVKEDRKQAYQDIKVFKKALLGFGLDKSGSISPELNFLFTEMGIPVADNTTVDVGPRIEIRGTTIPGGGLPGKWHSFLVYTDDQGQQFYIASHMIGDENDNPQAGLLQATLGAYAPGIHEWVPDADVRVLEEGPSAADKWGLMMAAANGVNQAEIRYKLLTTNCNRAAYHILKTAGVERVKPAGTAYVGWGEMLF